MVCQKESTDLQGNELNIDRKQVSSHDLLFLSLVCAEEEDAWSRPSAPNAGHYGDASM